MTGGKNKLGQLLATLLALTLATVAYSQEDYISEDDLFEEDDAYQETPTVPDPIRGFNRAMFNFNDFFYINILKPVSNTYRKIMPDDAEKGIGNFFDNLGYPVRLTGNVLQFKFGQAGKETGKFLFNSTVGMAGFFKVSDDYEMFDTTPEDMGQAFGAWGMGHGFYIVLPFLGPTTLRDGIGRIGDRYVDPISEPWTVVDETEYRISLTALEIVNDSPNLLNAYESLRGSAIDPYESLKDAYIQRRAKEVEQ